MKKLRFGLLFILSASLLTVSCETKFDISKTIDVESKKNLNTKLSGLVEFPNSFSIKANASDIIDKSTVSLIVPPNKTNANTTIASGITNSLGTFTINPDPNFKPQIDDIYILEASKRLGGEGKPVLTMKTFIKWTSNGWTSISGTNININTRTTAISIMSGYNPTILPPSDTIGKITIINGVSTLSDINSNVDIQKVLNVENLVNSSLTNNDDPTFKITYINGFLSYQNSSVLYTSPNPSPSPSTSTGSGSSSVTSLVYGKVFDPNDVPVEKAIVTAKIIDSGYSWTSLPQETVGGAYVFRDVPVGVRLLITVTKSDWTTRERTEIVKPVLTGDVSVNEYNFNKIYAIQDEPEITMLKVNGRQVTSSSNGDAFLTTSNSPKYMKPTPTQMDIGTQITDIGNVPSLTGVNSNAMEIEMTFSESIKVSDVLSYFRLVSQSGFDNRPTNFTVDGNYSGVEFVVSADEKTIIFKTNKALLTNKGGDEARYLIDFSQAFRDKTDKAAIDRRYFRFSPSQINDFAVFSLRNDETAPKLLGITARDGGSANDTIELRYSEPMELINLAGYTSALADPLAPSNLSRQLWYRDANTVMANSAPVANSTADNNATLVGFLYNSDIDPAQFRASYMIGRILSSEISSTTTNTLKTSILGSVTRTPKTTPVKGNTTANDLLRNSRVTGSNVLLEFSPTAFDRDDRVIVSVGKGIEGNFIDRNRTPSINDDLRVNISGTAVEYSAIYDPAGRLMDSGEPTSSANIDANNSQRVATAS
ncbi:MAG: carboxypeptidase-like regulatory domain-containing protein [Candidatus Sericytochromatia bacterium]